MGSGIINLPDEKKKIRCCENCGSTNMLSTHHKFPQTKVNLKYYGKSIRGVRTIDHPFNLQILCYNCHINERGIVRWNELQFCDALGIKPLSKTGKTFYKALNGEE